MQSMMPGAAGILLGSVETVAVTEALTVVGNELADRLLGPRQQVRVGATFTFAVEFLKKRISDGDSIRNDGFFDSLGDNRPAAEEIFEGVLLKAQDEYEEKKLIHYAYLLANVCFDKNIDQGAANYLLRMAERLSYRQLCFLELFYRVDKERVYDINEDFRRMKDITEGPGALGLSASVKSDDVLQEIREIKTMGLIRPVAPNEDLFYSLTPSGVGFTLREVLLLEKLLPTDLEFFVKQITRQKFPISR